MKRFLAIYTGTPNAMEEWRKLDDATRKSREAKGMAGWQQWSKEHEGAIVDGGGPLGKTKRASKGGITDIRNNMAAYTVVEAESHEAAAKLFENHPHFTLFPGDGVEIMECLPIPER